MSPINLPIYWQLFKDCKLVHRMVDAWSSNDELVAGGAQRRGYMGHLTKICNDILASADKGPYSSLVSTLLTGWYNYYVSDLHLA